MTTIEVGTTKFRVEFRHRNKFTKKPGLTRKAPFDAITTCTIIGLREQQLKMSGMAVPTDPIAFVAVGNSICVPGDRYSRREGRIRAFERAVADCGPMREIASDAVLAFRSLLAPVVTKIDKAKLSDDGKKAKWEAGAQVRAARAARNGVGTMPAAAS